MRTKLLLSLILTLAAMINCIANDSDHTTDANAGYLPILEDGKEWLMQERYMEGTGIPSRYYTFKVCGDSLINNHLYKKLYAWNVNSPETVTVGLMYEENGKLGWFDIMCDYHLDLIDMSLSVGDSIPITYIDWGENGNIYHTTVPKFVVKKKDTIEVYGIKRRRIDYHWVEGIGSKDWSWMVSFPIMTNGQYFKMLECRLNGDLIFSEEDFMTSELTKSHTAYSNPIPAIALDGNRLTLAPEAAEATVHNAPGQLVGRLLPGQSLTLPRGIYILRTANKITKVAL